MSLRIDLQTSRLLRFLQAGQIVLAMLATFLLAAEFLPALLLLVPVARILLPAQAVKKQPRALVLMAEEWYLVFEEDVVCADLCEEYYCTNWLQILQFHVQKNAAGKRECVWVVILPDSAGAEQRRKLRVALRWYGFARNAATQ